MSALAPHAGHSVRASILEWRAAITLLPREKGRDTTAQRRKVAVALGARD